MPRKAKLKTGDLTLTEKVYIAEHFIEYDSKWISEKLKRSEAVVGRYIEKLNKTPKAEKEKQKELKADSQNIKSQFTTQKGTATVMTEASGLPIKSKKRKSEFSTR